MILIDTHFLILITYQKSKFKLKFVVGAVLGKTNLFLGMEEMNLNFCFFAAEKLNMRRKHTAIGRSHSVLSSASNKS